MVSLDEQVGHGSVDVRLGTEFIVPRTTSFSEIDPMALLEKYERLLDQEFTLGIGEFQDRFFVRIGGSLVIHPGQLLLGSTLEYVRFPPDLMGQVLGRSSWGRMGLTIATATLVRSGVAGVVTLEIANVGNTPIRLYPGVRIAQLTVEQVDYDSDSTGSSSSKYQFSTRPDMSRVYADEDLKRIREVARSLDGRDAVGESGPIPHSTAGERGPGPEKQGGASTRRARTSASRRRA